MDLILSLVTLTALALVAGAVFLWRRNAPRRQVWLMLLLAAVMIGNVLVWSLPAPAPEPGETPPAGRTAG